MLGKHISDYFQGQGPAKDHFEKKARNRKKRIQRKKERELDRQLMNGEITEEEYQARLNDPTT